MVFVWAYYQIKLIFSYSLKATIVSLVNDPYIKNESKKDG